jgi:hypothetical protein
MKASTVTSDSFGEVMQPRYSASPLPPLELLTLVKAFRRADNTAHQIAA